MLSAARLGQIKKFVLALIIALPVALNLLGLIDDATFGSLFFAEWWIAYAALGIRAWRKQRLQPDFRAGRWLAMAFCGPVLLLVALPVCLIWTSVPRVETGLAVPGYVFFLLLGAGAVATFASAIIWFADWNRPGNKA